MSSVWLQTKCQKGFKFIVIIVQSTPQTVQYTISGLYTISVNIIASNIVSKANTRLKCVYRNTKYLSLKYFKTVSGSYPKQCILRKYVLVLRCKRVRYKIKVIQNQMIRYLLDKSPTGGPYFSTLLLNLCM